MSFSGKRDASHWLLHVRQKTAMAELPLPTSMSLDGFLGQWWPVKELGLRPKSRAAYESILRLHVPAEMRRLSLRGVTPSTVDRALRALTERGCYDQARKTRAVLHGLFEDARREGLVQTNPVAATRIPREPTRSRVRPQLEPGQCPAPGEVWQIADACPGWAKALVLTAGFSGLRWGELAALRPSDVDLDRGEIRVERSFCDLTRDEGPTKTAAGERLVVFLPALGEALEAHLARYSRDGLAFPTPEGSRLHHSNFRQRVWLPAVEALGRPWHFHDLRHTYASILISLGVPPPVVAHLLGHSSPAVTLSVYAGFWNGQLDEARLALAATEPERHCLAARCGTPAAAGRSASSSQGRSVFPQMNAAVVAMPNAETAVAQRR
jgi:integrase